MNRAKDASKYRQLATDSWNLMCGIVGGEVRWNLYFYAFANLSRSEDRSLITPILLKKGLTPFTNKWADVALN